MWVVILFPFVLLFDKNPFCNRLFLSHKSWSKLSCCRSSGFCEFKINVYNFWSVAKIVTESIYINNKKRISYSSSSSTCFETQKQAATANYMTSIAMVNRSERERESLAFSCLNIIHMRCIKWKNNKKTDGKKRNEERDVGDTMNKWHTVHHCKI